MEKGTVIRVKPTLDLKTGKYIEPTTKFVVVVGNSPKGCPIVRPLDKDESEILYNKIMHWSSKSECWRVYGHDTEIYSEALNSKIMHL